MPRLLATSLLAVVLAGCLAAPATEETPPTPDAPAAFELRACVVQEIIASAEPATLAPHLPDGFVAEAFPAEGRGSVIALTLSCREPEETLMGVVIIPLSAVPDGLGRENASAQGVITSIVFDKGASTKATLAAWGYGPTLADGAASMEDLAPAPADAAVRLGRTSVDVEGGGTFVIDTTVRGAPRTDEGNFLRFFMVHERQVLGTWDADLTGNHRIHSGEANMQATGYAPLSEGASAGLGFHETMDSFTWTRVAPGDGIGQAAP